MSRSPHPLLVCRQSQLCFIGFSQGTAQAFAAFSSSSELLEKIYLFVALSPAVRANHLSKSLLLSLVQANLRCVMLRCDTFIGAVRLPLVGLLVLLLGMACSRRRCTEICCFVGQTS